MHTNACIRFLTTVGKISLSSPSHVSLLLHGTFNASISANHLPPGEYEFVYDETVDEAQDEHAETEVEAGGEENGQAQEGGAVGDKSLGYWRRLRDGARLGGQDGRLDFTVIR